MYWVESLRSWNRQEVVYNKYVWGLSSDSRIFSLIWRRHHYRWRAAKFDQYSALMAIKQLGFFSVPHLLWHGASVYNGIHRGSVTIPSIAERFHFLCFRFRSVEAGIRTPMIRLWGQRSYTFRYHCGVKSRKHKQWIVILFINSNFKDNKRNTNKN